MAGNLPVPNGVELKLLWTWQAQPYALNILHGTKAGGAVIDQVEANAIDTAIKTAFTASALAAQIAVGVGLLRTSVRSMVNNTDPWYDGAGAAVPGTAAGNPLPAATSLVVTIRTGLRGRSYNGRFYTWGFSEDANDTAGGATLVASNAAQAFLQAVFTSLVAAPHNITLGVLSRWTTDPLTGTVIERNPPIITPAVAFVMRDQRWDVQRRRAVPGV
jgi:hypothetical protein